MQSEGTVAEGFRSTLNELNISLLNLNPDLKG
jgi:hypothetical protein